MPEMDVMILDVTRMKEDRICIAGLYYDEEKKYRNIRPVPPYGNICSEFLTSKCDREIEPFSVVRFNFSRSVENPPHVEDMVFEDRKAGAISYVKKVAPEKRKRILDSISCGSLPEIFGENLVDNKFLYEGEKGASLGCLAAHRVSGPTVKIKSYEDEQRKLEIRLGISTGVKKAYYSVVERRLYKFVLDEIAKGKTVAVIESELKKKLFNVSPVYVRVGLTRPWRKQSDEDKDPRKKCWVQVLGIHTFPDYLTKEI